MEASKNVAAIFFKNQNITTLSLSYTSFSAYTSLVFVVAPSYSSCCRVCCHFSFALGDEGSEKLTEQGVLTFIWDLVNQEFIGPS